MSTTKAARASTAQANEFFSLSAKYQIAAEATPNDLLEDTMSFLSCARGILQSFLSTDSSSEELFGISFLLEMAYNTLDATRDFAIDGHAMRKVGAK